ncbi:MAG: hypothetical protein RIC36_03450 [Rhodospirillales bacterium]
MTEILALFTPTLPQVLNACAVLLTVLVLSGLGAAATGRWRFNEADLMTGAGVAITAMTLIGALSFLPLSWIGYVILAAGLAGLTWRTFSGELVSGPGSGKAIILLLPLLLLLTGMQASQWDEFSHWLHSARYLFEYDSFPRTGLPESRASYPAYPYGLSDLTLLVSLISRQFGENTTILLNTFMLGAFGLVLLRVAELAAGPSRPEMRGWGAAAFALIAGMLTFPVQKILFSSYADAATALLLGTAAACGWRAIEALERGASARATSPAIQFGWIMAAVVALKQANFVLFVILTIAVIATAVVTPNLRLKSLLRVLIFMVLPALAVFITWRVYIDLYLPGGAEFTITDEERWVFHLAPEILARMLDIALKKGVYFGLMLLILFLGLRGLMRHQSPLDRLALICGLTFLGYNCFLFMMYLMAFGENEARSAASFWRYNMHLFGLAALPVAWLAGSWAADRFAAAGRTIAAIIATALIIALPFGLSEKIRFDHHPVKDYIRDITQEMKSLLPAGARLMPVDPEMTIFYGLVVNYDLTGTADVGGYIHIRNAPARYMTLYQERFRPTHLFVHTVNDDVDSFTGLELDRRASHLLERSGAGWQIVRSWPYPGYNSPTEFKH